MCFLPLLALLFPEWDLGWVADKSHVTTEHARWIHKGAFLWILEVMFLEICERGMYCDICPRCMIYDEVTGENLKRKRLGHGNNLKMNEAGNWYVWCGIINRTLLYFFCEIHVLFRLRHLSDRIMEHSSLINLFLVYLMKRPATLILLDRASDN